MFMSGIFLPGAGGSMSTLPLRPGVAIRAPNDASNWQQRLQMCQHESMPGNRGSGRQLTPLPDDLAPEVRRLAECLRSHFEEMGTSIRAYAQRASWDAGTISRFLSGDRIASRRFVDRLVADAGAQHGPEEIEQKQTEAQDLRSEALRACNAKAAESERIVQDLREAEDEIKLYRTRERALTKQLDNANGQYQLLLEKYEEMQRAQNPASSPMRQLDSRITREKNDAEKEVNRLKDALEVERSARIDAERRRDALQTELDENRADLLKSGGSSAPAAALYGSRSTLMVAIQNRRAHWGNWVAVGAIPIVVFGVPIYLGIIFRDLSSRNFALKIITVFGIFVPIWLAWEALRASARSSSKTGRHLLRVTIVMAILFLIFAFI